MHSNAKSQKILWIEDDYYHMKDLFRPLRKMGYDVIPAESSLKAHRLLQNWQNYCLIVLDLIIPYSDEEFSQSETKIAQNPDGSQITMDLDTDEDAAENGIALFSYMTQELKVNIPIMLLSIVRTQEIVEHLLNNGATKHLEKGALSPQDVKSAVMAIFGQE